MSVQITTAEEARRVLGRGLMQTTEDVALTRLEVAGLLALLWRQEQTIRRQRHLLEEWSEELTGLRIKTHLLAAEKGGAS